MLTKKNTAYKCVYYIVYLHVLNTFAGIPHDTVCPGVPSQSLEMPRLRHRHRLRHRSLFTRVAAAAVACGSTRVLCYLFAQDFDFSARGHVASVWRTGFACVRVPSSTHRRRPPHGIIIAVAVAAVAAHARVISNNII